MKKFRGEKVEGISALPKELLGIYDVYRTSLLLIIGLSTLMGIIVSRTHKVRRKEQGFGVYS